MYAFLPGDNLKGMKRTAHSLIFPALFVIGCSSPPETEVTVIDYRNTSGAYVLAYSPDEELRTRFEDRLVSDLGERGLKAFPSYPDIPDIHDSSREVLLGAANAKKAMFVLVVDEVRHGEKGIIPGDNRFTHEHPTLQDFYEHSKPEEHEHGDDEQVFVEVSAFLIQGEFAKLVWSGTTWSINADGDDTRIADISATIADAIYTARRRREMGFD